MRSEMIDGGRTFALVLDKGDEVVGSIESFAQKNNLNASHMSGIGAFSYVVLGFFDWERKDYQRIHIDQQVEVLSLVGDIVLKNGRPKLHPHVVVAKADGTAHGGHLLEGYVRPTLEVVIEESQANLHRETDEESGLALIQM